MAVNTLIFQALELFFPRSFYLVEIQVTYMNVPIIQTEVSVCFHTTVLMLHGIPNKDISFIREMVRNKISFTYTLATV